MCTFVGQPLVYWKNATQQHLPFTLNPKYLYRGLIASITNYASLAAIQFVGTGLIKRTIINHTNRDLKSHEILLSAYAGGAISGIVSGPLELTMIQQQRFGGNIIATPLRIIETTGLLGMTRGLMLTMIRTGLFSCGYLGITPLLEQKIKRYDTLIYSGIPLPIIQFGCSMIASFVAVSLSHPVDTVKTCMQGDIEQNTYTRAINTMSYIRNEYGMRGLYRGVLWQYSRSMLVFFVFNRTVGPVASTMYPHAFVN
eukprot:105269_1